MSDVLLHETKSKHIWNKWSHHILFMLHARLGQRVTKLSSPFIPWFTAQDTPQLKQSNDIAILLEFPVAPCPGVHPWSRRSHPSRLHLWNRTFPAAAYQSWWESLVHALEKILSKARDQKHTSCRWHRHIKGEWLVKATLGLRKVCRVGNSHETHNAGCTKPFLHRDHC